MGSVNNKTLGRRASPPALTTFLQKAMSTAFRGFALHRFLLGSRSAQAN